MDPRADLREATERNAREAQEEWEAAERRTAQAAKELADAAAKARVEAAAAETKAEASHNQPPLLVIPLRAVALDIPVPPSEEVDQDPPVMERREDHMVSVEGAPQMAPTGAGQSGQSAAAPEQPAGGEPEAGAGLEVQPALRRRAGGVTSAPEPHRAAGASQTAEALEAASASTSEWTPSGGTAELNTAAQEVRSRLQAQAASLQGYTQEFLATRAVIRVSLLALVILLF